MTRLRARSRGGAQGTPIPLETPVVQANLDELAQEHEQAPVRRRFALDSTIKKCRGSLAQKLLVRGGEVR